MIMKDSAPRFNAFDMLYYNGVLGRVLSIVRCSDGDVITIKPCSPTESFQRRGKNRVGCGSSITIPANDWRISLCINQNAMKDGKIRVLLD